MAKIDDNGVIRDMTPEEIAALSHVPEPEPTLEERNRADIDYLAMMMEVEL